MKDKIIKLKVVCPACKGTGIYVGMAEKDGAGVICYKCEGTGCYEYEYKYKEFAGRKKIKGIKRVFAGNPGIGIGEGNGYKLKDFGGMPFKEWEEGKPFPEKSEMRKFTCPAWFYQTVDYKKKPDWKECWETLGSTFSHCPYFKHKEKCWERWDKEQKDTPDET